MKKIVQAWTGISLVQRIVAGLVIGALLGMFVPSEGGIAILGDVFRSEERRVGKECRSRWSPYH